MFAITFKLEKSNVSNNMNTKKFNWFPIFQTCNFGTRALHPKRLLYRDNLFSNKNNFN